MLSRRLKQFSNTGDGIGQQILQLNSVLEETRGALKEAQSSAKKASEGLTREVAQARKAAAQLKELNQAAEAHAAALLSAVKTAEQVALDMPEHDTSVAPSPIAHRPPDGEEVPETPDEDDDEINFADIGPDDPAGEPTGEQQLGFVPDDPDLSAQMSEGEADVQAAGDDIGEPVPEEAPSTESLPLVAHQEEEKTPETKGFQAAAPIETGPPPEDGGDGLLKVERMAL